MLGAAHAHTLAQAVLCCCVAWLSPCLAAASPARPHTCRRPAAAPLSTAGQANATGMAMQLYHEDDPETCYPVTVNAGAFYLTAAIKKAAGFPKKAACASLVDDGRGAYRLSNNPKWGAAIHHETVAQQLIHKRWKLRVFP